MYSCVFFFLFPDGIISSSKKVLFGDSTEAPSLPQEPRSPTPHAHTFNDFLNVTECQTGGNKSRGPPPARH